MPKTTECLSSDVLRLVFDCLDQDQNDAVTNPGAPYVALATVNKFFLEHCLPRIYASINERQFCRPALAATLAKKPHYGQFVRKVRWEMGITTFSDHTWKRLYIPSQFVPDSAISQLRLFVNIVQITIVWSGCMPVDDPASLPEELQYLNEGHKVDLTIPPAFPQPLTLPRLHTAIIAPYVFDPIERPVWSLILWLVAASPVTRLKLAAAFACAFQPNDMPMLSSVREIAFSTQWDQLTGLRCPSPLLSLCENLGKAEFTFGGSHDMAGSMQGQRVHMSSNITQLQIYFSTLSKNQAMQHITQLSLASLEVKSLPSPQLSIGSFSFCNHLTLSFAALEWESSSASLLHNIKTLFSRSSAWTALTSITITIKPHTQSICTSTEPLSASLAIFRNQETFPNLQSIQAQVYVAGPTALAAAAFAASYHSQVKHIARDLAEDIRDLTKDLCDFASGDEGELGLHVRVLCGEDDGNKSCLVFDRPAGGEVTIRNM